MSSELRDALTSRTRSRMNAEQAGEIGRKLSSEPTSAARMSYPARVWIVASVLCVGYFLGVHVGIAFTLEPKAISILWPPNALVLAALLLTPVRAWWVPVAAVFPAHMIAEVSLGVPVTMALCWFFSNIAEGLLGAGLLIRFLGAPPKFDRVRDASAFLAIGVVISPLATSFLDAGFVALVGWRSTDYWEMWRMRLFSNALAALTLVPLSVIWAQRGFGHLRRVRLAAFTEGTLLLAGLCVTSIYVFTLVHPPSESAVLMYAPLPFLMWAAVRQGIAGVTACVMAVAAFAITGVLGNLGPFASDTPESAALSVQLFLVLASSSSILLAASLSELREARASALQQKDRFELALGAARMGTWEWNIPGDRLTWSAGEQENARADSNSCSLRDFFSRVHSDDLSTVARTTAQLGSNGGLADLEFRIRCGDDGYRWISSRGRMLTYEGGARRISGVYVDTTDRKLQDTQARVQREQLTHLSRVATLGELSGAIAHELNQPLTAILVNAQAARREVNGTSPDLPEVDECLADVIAQSKRAGAAIERLRALFKRGVLQRRHIDLNECIREVLALEHSDLIMRNVVTHVELADERCMIDGDRIQLEQAVLNLVVNACDAMANVPIGARHLRIVSSKIDDAIQLHISDTGPGLTDPEAIFEPFFSTKQEGIGLGLAVCRTIIASHDGRLWASNNETRGAAFHIELPDITKESARPSPHFSNGGLARGARS